MNLVWNAIIKNESAILPRCLNSLLPHVDGAIVVDTGSTDGSPEIIKQAFTMVGKPVEISHVPFENFGQARNAALRVARESNLPWTHLLLSDADMELCVEKPNWFNGEHDGLSYDMRQIAGEAVVYLNRRILARQAQGEYKCPTHEFLDVPTSGLIEGAYFKDYADGANRSDKLKRDVELLENALRFETNPGLIQRLTFYLAQSYFDLEWWALSAEQYKRRVELGGWEEEVFVAQMHYAHCLGNLGNRADFLWEMLKAYEMRPQRAESLYDMAKFFRELGDANFRSLLFSELGLQITKPDDALFVNKEVYSHGLKEEFAICAYYDPARRSRGADACNGLALDPVAPLGVRQQARFNQFWYLQPLSQSVRSFTATRIDFTPPDNYVAMNPSVINHNGNLLALIRTVNYAITPEGRYISRTGDVSRDGADIIITRNFLARLSVHGAVEHSAEIQPPRFWEPPQFELVRGFEDSRLFECGQLWTISTVRERTREGWCEQIVAPIVDDGEQVCYGADWKAITPQGEKRNEKNWMPMVCNGKIQFVYRLGTILDTAGYPVHKHEPHFTLDHISGGSQMIQIASELYLAIVHEAGQIPGRMTRFYQHRFVTMLPDGTIVFVSPPFYFHDRQIEFAAGLARFDDELVISYGVRDEEAWIARMRLDEVLRFI